MIKNNAGSKQLGVDFDPGKLRDLSDFCQHWPELRSQVSDENLMVLALPDNARQIIEWLVRLADRVHHDEEG